MAYADHRQVFKLRLGLPKRRKAPPPTSTEILAWTVDSEKVTG